MRQLLQNQFQRIKEEFRGWSLVHFLFDAFLTAILGILFGWFSEIAWMPLIILCLLLFGTIATGIILIQNGLKYWISSRNERLYGANARVYDRAKEIIDESILQIKDSYTEASVEQAVNAASSMLAGLISTNESHTFWSEVVGQRHFDQWNMIKPAAIAYLEGKVATIPRWLRDGHHISPNKDE